VGDKVALIFGIAVLAIAAGLAGWEIYVFRKNAQEFDWLHTPRRLRRRLLMAVLLLMVAALVLGDSFGVLALDNVRNLMIYVISLTGLALLLFVLSVRDLADMARSAERHAIQDLQSAIDEQKKKEAGPRDTIE